MKLQPVAIVFATVFIDLLGFGIIIPLLPFYAETFGATAFTVGMLATSFSLMQFLFAPFWGRLSDRVGRRPVILVGLLGSSLAYLAFGLASTLTTLFAARVFAGIAGANIPTVQAVMADLTTPENRAKGMGLFGAAFGLGFIFGPAIGGFLSRWGYSAPAFFASGLALANFTAALFLLPETLKPEHRAIRRAGRLDALRAAMAKPHLPLLMLIGFLAVAAFASFETTFALYSEHVHGFTASTIGYVFALIGVVMVIVQGGLVGRAVKLVGEHHLVPVSLAVVAAGLFLIATSRSAAVVVAANAVMAAGMGFNNPALASLISRCSSAEDQGGVMGLVQSLNSLARIAGPLWGGYAFDRLGVVMPYFSGSAVMAVAAALAVRALWKARLAAAPETVAIVSMAAGSSARSPES
ncbi:MAG TPA: MFS transporter [Vicinamibacterales bacterium]|nr:MFS transporter [Vicinamibacterales bacterium]